MVEERNILAEEKEIGRRTQRNNPYEVGLCQRLFDHLRNSLNSLEPQTQWDERASTMLQLLALAYNSLRWAFELLLKGYYTQANSLSQLAWEAWLNGAYLHLFPECPLDHWRELKTRPRPVKMRRLVAKRAADVSPVAKDSFRADMDAMYTAYSGYSHPSDRALRVLTAEREGELWLRLGPDYDEALLLESTNFFCTAAAMVSTLFYMLPPVQPQFEARDMALRTELRTWRRDMKRRLTEMLG